MSRHHVFHKEISVIPPNTGVVTYHTGGDILSITRLRETQLQEIAEMSQLTVVILYFRQHFYHKNVEPRSKMQGCVCLGVTILNVLWRNMSLGNKCLVNVNLQSQKAGEPF